MVTGWSVADHLTEMKYSVVASWSADDHLSNMVRKMFRRCSVADHLSTTMTLVPEWWGAAHFQTIFENDGHYMVAVGPVFDY